MMTNKTEVLKQYLIPYPLSVYFQTIQFRRFTEDTHFLYVSYTVSKSHAERKILD